MRFDEDSRSGGQNLGQLRFDRRDLTLQEVVSDGFVTGRCSTNRLISVSETLQALSEIAPLARFPSSALN